MRPYPRDRMEGCAAIRAGKGVRHRQSWMDHAKADDGRTIQAGTGTAKSGSSSRVCTVRAAPTASAIAQTLSAAVRGGNSERDMVSASLRPTFPPPSRRVGLLLGRPCRVRRQVRTGCQSTKSGDPGGAPLDLLALCAAPRVPRNGQGQSPRGHYILAGRE